MVTHHLATERHLPEMGSHSDTVHPTQINALHLNPSQPSR